MTSSASIYLQLPPSGIEILVQFIQDQRMRLKEFFFQFDKDHSGDITRSEFKTGLKETGIQMTDVSQLIIVVDLLQVLSFCSLSFPDYSD